MGLTKSELADLVETVWNPVISQVPYGKPIRDDMGEALVEWLWRLLKKFDVATVREAMNRELTSVRPDIRRIEEQCLWLAPKAKGEG